MNKVLLLSAAQPEFFKGGVRVCQIEGTHQIVVSFSPPFVGCLLEKKLTKGGGGVTGTPEPPWLRP